MHDPASNTAVARNSGATNTQ